MPTPKRLDEAVDTALDHALRVQRTPVRRYVDRLRDKPGATPASVIDTLDSRYRAAVISIGVAAGGAAAVPGVGTVASIASGVAEIGAFVEATALYTMAVAEVHGLQVSDQDTRRALVVAVLLGQAGTTALTEATGRDAQHWVGALRAGLPERDTGRIGHINSVLGRHLIARFGARQGSLVLGRAMPLGIGAGIGAAGNAALAKASIKGARKLFGPPPTAFPPRVIEG